MNRFILRLTLLVAVLALPAASPDAVSPQTDRTAREILDRYVTAVGGEKVWKEFKNIRTVSETETFGIKRRVTRIEEPASGRFHASSEGPEGTYENGFDGNDVWRRTAWGQSILPENDWQRSLMKDWRERQLRNWKTSGAVFRSSPDETIDGKRYHVVATTQLDEAGNETAVRHYFDPKTHLLERAVRGNPGNAFQAITIYSDYRAVYKVRVPFKTISENPQFRSVTTLLEWKANVDVAPTIFEFAPKPELPAMAELEGIDLSEAKVVRPGDPNLPPEVAKAIEQARAGNKGGDGARVVTIPQHDRGALTEDRRLETFNTVWNTINDTYWDPTFGGNDWKAIGDAYRPRAVAAEDSKELHDVLNEMVNQLGQTHFRVLGPDKTRTIGSTRALPGTLGMSHRGIDGELVVTNVEDDRPAAEAGIEKGFAIRTINGKPVTRLQEELIAREPVHALRPDAALMRAAALEMGGDAGGVVELELLDHDDNTVTKKLTRASRSLSEMTRLKFESRWLDEGKIGYVRISSFFGDAAEQLAAALKEMHSAETILLDLRGNGGGAGDLAPTIAGMFARERGTLGLSRMRHGIREYAYEPAPGAFTGALIILVDGGSASTSEVFAGGLQESGRAKIIGTITRGGVLPSLLALLPSGGALQHVISDFRTPKGVVLEGRGVIPDIEIAVSRADLIAGRDPILERGLAEARLR